MGRATLKALLAEAEQRLSSSPTPRLDAEVILCEVLKSERSHLYASAEEEVLPEQQRHYRRLVVERARGVPVAYLRGWREFWSLRIEVNRHTLIPRPETEHMVEAALELIRARGSQAIADLGTGTGCIALAIASEYPSCQITATDIAEEALEVARQNTKRLGLHNLEFRYGDWCEALDGKRFDLILSNPPYVASGDPHLRAGDLRFEPPRALLGGADGLTAIRRIIADVMRYLRPGGWLALEHGCDQKGALWDLLRSSGFRNIQTVRDYSGQDRVTLARGL